MRDATLDVDVIEDAAQDTVHGDRPAVGRAENQPVIFLEVQTGEPVSVLFECLRPLGHQQADLGLEPVLVGVLVGQVQAGLGLLGADVDRQQNLVVEQFDPGKVTTPTFMRPPRWPAPGA